MDSTYTAWSVFTSVFLLEGLPLCPKEAQWVLQPSNQTSFLCRFPCVLVCDGVLDPQGIHRQDISGRVRGEAETTAELGDTGGSGQIAQFRG